MIQAEMKDYIYSLCVTLAKRQCYIKGYGGKYRGCDAAHNPIMNISKQEMNVLKFNGVVYQDGLVFRPNDFTITLKNAKDVKLPTKADQ